MVMDGHWYGAIMSVQENKDTAEAGQDKYWDSAAAWIKKTGTAGEKDIVEDNQQRMRWWTPDRMASPNRWDSNALPFMRVKYDDSLGSTSMAGWDLQLDKTQWM